MPAPDPDRPYRVELVPWDGHKHGAEHLEQELNRFAGEGWTVISVVPTRAGASAKALLGVNASADTIELAVVLSRAGG